MDKPVTPRGINHLVLNVRDLGDRFLLDRMWASARSVAHADRNGRTRRDAFLFRRSRGWHNHHDVALVENRDLPKPPGTGQCLACPVR
jgi:hypothetical protein